MDVRHDIPENHKTNSLYRLLIALTLSGPDDTIDRSEISSCDVTSCRSRQ
jgi:hypothetical protein